MYPEDRVLVGVIKARRDLDRALHERWYRIPQARAPKDIHAEVIAFFLSRAFKELNGGIHYYAERTGVELVRRRDLLPEESHHARADGLYYKLQLGVLCRKDPPVLNPTHRSVTFIYTTWDRFCAARVLADLYSEADQFVDRVFHALEAEGVCAERIWQVSRLSDDGGAQLRIVCDEGTVIASTEPLDEHILPLVPASTHRAIRQSVESILDAIRQHGGPAAGPMSLKK